MALVLVQFCRTNGLRVTLVGDVSFVAFPGRPTPVPVPLVSLAPVVALDVSLAPVVVLAPEVALVSLAPVVALDV